jgi:hypothetical protein
MPHLSTQGRRSTPASRSAVAVALPILLLACGGLTACGSSASSTSTKTAANAAASDTATQTTGAAGSSTTSPGTTGSGTTTSGAATTPPGGGTGPGGRPGGARFAAVRECLRKDGITLPQRSAGGVPSGGPTLPKGMTQAQYTAVLSKCGGGNFRGPGALKGRRAFDNARFRQTLAKFATCLRQNGIKLPQANTSGKGPIFDTKGINTASPQFKQAEVKCRAVLLAGIRQAAGSSRGGAPGAAPAG